MQTLKKILISLFLLHILWIELIILSSIYLRFYNPGITSLMIYRKVINKFENMKLEFISIDLIKKKHIILLVHTEDPDFYLHYGIDIESMKNAYKVNKKLGYKYSGASTITQQFARTMFLFPDKLYVRKYFEILASLIMEMIIPKNRILELYINCAETGKGIYGFETASLYYYKKSFAALSDQQVINLFTILSSPIRYSPKNFSNRKRLLYRNYFLSSELKNIQRQKIK